MGQGILYTVTFSVSCRAPLVQKLDQNNKIFITKKSFRYFDSNPSKINLQIMKIVAKKLGADIGNFVQ